MSDYYCASCRKDIESCHCATTFHWKERVASQRRRGVNVSKRTKTEKQERVEA